MMHGSRDVECEGIFSLFVLCPNNPENHNFEKVKKALGDIIILHKCTINNNHMIYGS